nr:ATP synthase delta chain, chloroplastic [Ipomoea batatas]GMD82468.1 ATP synthase delta chain, chloroplastic [Ipomoea batatas]
MHHLPFFALKVSKRCGFATNSSHSTAVDSNHRLVDDEARSLSPEALSFRKSYAVALCDVSKSNGTLEKTSADLKKIEKVFTEESVFDLFANPIMSDEKKRELLPRSPSRLSSSRTWLINFLNILVDMDHITVYNKITVKLSSLRW